MAKRSDVKITRVAITFADGSKLEWTQSWHADAPKSVLDRWEEAARSALRELQRLVNEKL